MGFASHPGCDRFNITGAYELFLNYFAHVFPLLGRRRAYPGTIRKIKPQNEGESRLSPHCAGFVRGLTDLLTVVRREQVSHHATHGIVPAWLGL